MAGPIRSRLRRARLAFSSSKVGGIFYHRVCRHIDRVLIPLSKGRWSMGPADTLLMTTTGARSGRPRVAALAFLRDGDDLVLIASKGGAPRHPGWYHNLVADPTARLEYHGQVEQRVAREAVGAERDRLFELAKNTYGTYAAYETRAVHRTIPVMVLSRT